MAHEFTRNIQDAAFAVADFALPATASASTQSDAVDLAAVAPVFPPQNVELELKVPALSATIAPDTRIVTYVIESSTTSTFTATAKTLMSVAIAGASNAGIAAQAIRCRIPPGCERYVRGRVAFGASTTDGSALKGAFGVRF